LEEMYMPLKKKRDAKTKVSLFELTTIWQITNPIHCQLRRKKGSWGPISKHIVR
jgi:hypothetical protein